MSKCFNQISIWIGLIGGLLCKILGGWDKMLLTLVALVVLDYITGILKAIYEKKLSSEIGYRGIVKKVAMFVVVSLSYFIEELLGGSIPLREIVIVFFVANEGLSLLENVSVMLPIPAKLKDTLLQLRNKAESDNNE